MTTTVEQQQQDLDAGVSNPDPDEKHVPKTDHLLTDEAMNNNETYEKTRPLKRSTSTSNVLDQGHGDDHPIKAPEEPDRAIHFVEHSSVNGTHEGDLSVSSHFGLSIPPVSSSSDDFSMEMPIAVTDTSNEALKTDEENGMTKPYSSALRLHYPSEENHLNFSDYSLQPKLPAEECEYDIDLGNGSITKSTSSYQSDEKQQRRSSIISADSVPVTHTSHLPFTNPFYERHHRTKQDFASTAGHDTNVLFNADDLIREKRPAQWSINTIVTVAAGITTIALTIVLVFLFL